VAAPFSFNDIRFWVGIGENRAAVAIDWFDDVAEPPALVWGYRWDDSASGAEMLLAVVSADPRLFAKLQETPLGLAVYGLGYDANDDGQFALDDGTVFDSAGIAWANEPDDTVGALGGDHYAEGWLLGFWHYGASAGDPFGGGAWASSGAGVSNRMLTAGAWDSWAFESPITTTKFAANPWAAPSPFPLGDYNRNGGVDLGDYTHWKSLYGSTSDPSADGNFDGVVSAADYTVWRNQLIATAEAKAVAGQTGVPEPSPLLLAFLASVSVPIVLRRRTHATT
jgi:hypothetical protein